MERVDQADVASQGVIPSGPQFWLQQAGQGEGAKTQRRLAQKRSTDKQVRIDVVHD
jgi:hypothetical protein